MKRPAGAADPKDASKGVNLKTGKLGNEVLSPEQAAVCNFVEGGAGSAIITARAGSGKTWILIQALNRIRDDKKVRIDVVCTWDCFPSSHRRFWFSCSTKTRRTSLSGT